MAYGDKPPPKKKEPPKKKALPKLKPLSKRMETSLKKHEEHHTKKHMKKMRLLLREGKSFKQAHAIALKMVGE